MLSARGNGHFSKSSRTTVDFPAPDGPEITIKWLLPERSMRRLELTSASDKAASACG
jgi:hypothetical protein